MDIAPPILQILEQDPEESKMARAPDEVLRDALQLPGNAVFQTSRINAEEENSQNLQISLTVLILPSIGSHKLATSIPC